MIESVNLPTDRELMVERPSSSAHFESRGPNLTSDPFPATLDGEYHKVDTRVEAPWLQAMVPHLRTLLPALARTDRVERLEQLAQLTCPTDWWVQQEIEISTNGHVLTVEILRSVPLLTEQEVRVQMASIPNEAWSQLMQLSYQGQTFYLAEQFDIDGALLPVCQQIMRIFKANPGMSDWEIAIWWINPTGWLSDACPQQVYLEEPEAVINAAEQEVAKNYG